MEPLQITLESPVHLWSTCRTVSPTMPAITIQIPAVVTNDSIQKLLRLLQGGASSPEVILDFTRVRFLVPGAIVAILAYAHRWHRVGKQLTLRNIREAENFRYLQRIDFFNTLGINTEEDFNRRDSEGRFVPVRELTKTEGDVNRISTELSHCVFPQASYQDDHYALFQYATGEMLSNGKYHSEGKVFVCAQYFSERNLAMLAIADDGIGIAHSFRGTPREEEACDGHCGLRLALQPGVSSPLLRAAGNPYYRPNNRGIGLPMTRILTREALGHLQIGTGNGWLDEKGGGRSEVAKLEGLDFPGTFVSLAVNRDQVGNYQTLRNEALREIGMDQLDGDAMFI